MSKAEINSKLVCISCHQWKPLVSFLHRGPQQSIIEQIYCCEDCIDTVADEDINFVTREDADKKTGDKPDGYILLGTVVSFPENKIHFYQDHRFWEGVPTGVNFTVEEPSSSDDFWLVADGYGNIDKPNAYGNGSICVKEKDIRWAKTILE